MKISITAHDCARIYLSNTDMRSLGLSEIQGEPSAEMRLLVSGIAAFLSQLGLLELGSGEIDCTVSEVFDGIVVQIVPKEPDCVESTRLLVIFEDAKRLKQFCLGLSGEVCEKVCESELYRLGKRYHLIMTMSCPRSCLLSLRHFCRAVYDDGALIEKSREYGTFLSRTPIEDIRKLRYP